MSEAKRPWCETCGKDVAEVLCPTCAKWWNDNNPPPTDAEIVEMLAKAMQYTMRRMGVVPKWTDYATACLQALRNAGLIGDGKPYKPFWDNPDGPGAA